MRFITSFIIAITLALALPAFAESPLASPKKEDKTAATHNDEGIKAFKVKKWKDAEMHFMEAVKADPKFAEGHFNLGLAYHMDGMHKEATEEFKQANTLAPKNDKIAKSEILQHHLKM